MAEQSWRGQCGKDSMAVVWRTVWQSQCEGRDVGFALIPGLWPSLYSKQDTLSSVFLG